MSTTTLLWAAGIGDLLPFIIAVIVAVLSILFQYLRNAGEAAKPQQGPRPANQPQPPARPRPQQQPIDEEIGEFLRRAAQRRGGQPVVVSPPRDEPVAAVVVAERPVGGEVERHVKQLRDTRELEQRSRHFGADATVASDTVEANLRGTFAHHISSVGSPTMSAADRKRLTEPPQTQGRNDPGALGDTGLVGLLTDADSIREAIILNEILRRPEERW